MGMGGEGWMSHGLADPLAAARAIAAVDATLTKRGFTASLETDFAAFSAIRRKLRSGKPESAVFDPEASALSAKTAFWMSLTDCRGEVVALQAFRADHAQPTLADWALGWMIGVYVKRSELVVPQSIQPPATSIAHKLSGTVVYHGELWLKPEVRGEQILEPFARLGMLSSYIRWRPKAIWALNSDKIAYFANTSRWGYSHQERGFMRWQFQPDGACQSEWLSVADRPSLERLIRDVVIRRSEYRRDLLLKSP
jgi:hypothetical protein